MMQPLDLGRWCILRMSSATTLAVHDSLERAGFDVWTPRETRLGKMPRTGAQAERQYAITPSFVFADATRIDDLAKIALVPRDHPRFTLFKHLYGYPLIADAELASLRGEEERRNQVFRRMLRRGRKGPVLRKGEPVRLTGGFEGLQGTVREQQGNYTLVDIPGFNQPIRISSILLAEDAVDTIAKAA